MVCVPYLVIFALARFETTKGLLPCFVGRTELLAFIGSQKGSATSFTLEQIGLFMVLLRDDCYITHHQPYPIRHTFRATKNPAHFSMNTRDRGTQP